MGLIKDRELKIEPAYHSEHGFIYSMGNRKMGRVMSFSLPPIITCHPNAPCKDGDCYAIKMQRIYPTVKDSWKKNYELITSDECWGDIFVDDTVAAIRKKQPAIFRWHVSGDIFSSWYLDDMRLIAEKCKDVQFWAFTKQFNILERYDRKMIPKNLNIILSIWPPHLPSDDLMKEYGCCYFQDKKESYDVPEDAYVCQGDCEECQVCTYLVPGDSVVIYKH